MHPGLEAEDAALALVALACYPHHDWALAAANVVERYLRLILCWHTSTVLLGEFNHEAIGLTQSVLAVRERT